MVKREKMVKGISTSVLFDMSEPDRIFREQGKDAYIANMKQHADDPLSLGRGFKHLKKAFENPDFEEVVLCSKNSPITARRAIITMQNEGVTPGRMFFTNGQSPVPFLEAYGIKHFYTANRKDAIEGNKAGVFSTYYDLAKNTKVNNPVEAASVEGEKEANNKVVQMRQYPLGQAQLRTVFNGKMIAQHVYDLDGVVFDSESEDFFQGHNLEAYDDYEKKLRDVPMNAGPAYELFKHYNDVNNGFVGDDKPYGISIVTARGNNAALRAIETLYQWDEDVSGSAHFLAGTPKQPVLHVLAQMAEEQGQSIEFYDDQVKNVDMGTEAGILAGQVPDIRENEEDDGPDGCA